MAGSERYLAVLFADVSGSTKPVSYTHLDVYKRQDSEFGVASMVGSLYVVAAPSGAGKTCLLYTSRCV